jgi:RHH-type transcriptional regulator, rel operon repressor / antitoxin RelB
LSAFFIAAFVMPGWTLIMPVSLSSATSVMYLYDKAHMLAIRLPQAIEKRLERLARRTGRTKSFYVRQAILQHLEDLEDMYLAERTLRRIQDGEKRTIPLEAVLKRHGVED